MGEKGSQFNQNAADSSQEFVDKLFMLGDITRKKMFGGYGIFADGAMFALVNSQGNVFLKADDTNRVNFETAASPQHGKMPYFSIPEEIMADVKRLQTWAAQSIEIARAAKKK